MICINTVLSNRIRMESKRNMETKLISLVLVDFGYQSSFVVKTSDFANEYRLSAAKYLAYPRKYHKVVLPKNGDRHAASPQRATRVTAM